MTHFWSLWVSVHVFFSLKHHLTKPLTVLEAILLLLFFFNHPTSSDGYGGQQQAGFFHSHTPDAFCAALLGLSCSALVRPADAGACPRVSLWVGLRVVRLAWLYQACWSSLECDWRWMTFPRTPPACWHLFLTLRMRAGGGGGGLFESAGSMGLPLVLQNGSSNS